jgi:hypothetical protein
MVCLCVESATSLGPTRSGTGSGGVSRHPHPSEEPQRGGVMAVGEKPPAARLGGQLHGFVLFEMGPATSAGNTPHERGLGANENPHDLLWKIDEHEVLGRI